MRRTIWDSKSKRKVFILSGRTLFSTRLARHATRENDLSVCGQLAQAVGAVRTITSLRPAVLVIDIPKLTPRWLKVVKEVREADSRIKVLAICDQIDPRSADRVLRAGAGGYILPSEGLDEIVGAIHDLIAGGLYVSEKVLAAAPERAPSRRAKSRSYPVRMPSPSGRFLKSPRLRKNSHEMPRPVNLSAE
jgi:DNA-binding NarL/FixJ family response regulator